MSGDPRALLQKADKAYSGAASGFSLFGGKEQKYMDAVDLYIEAANAFRMQKMNVEAGKAFEKAASIQTSKLNEPDDAANVMVDAFKVYKTDSPDDAVRCLDVAISQYCKKGNFRRAAQHMENMGEVFETQVQDNARALECFEKAAGWYESDNAAALANKLWLKVADIAALAGDYYKSIEHYERVAAASINNNLMRYSVKDYFLKAGICHLATGDMVATNRALEKYRDMDPTFPSNREHQLLVDLAAAVEGGDQDAFTDKLFQFDRMSKLDKWKTTILVRVKESIEEAGEDFS
ncbi:alpha-soluble NSF attachment protein [Pseudomassariella vexata]|uniref:Alpha-soluble NSF attachment protein n=1 Tax=Pseudomassariella vexata TaxID=1141098 RepID=A0A1Y2DZ34_9PEZI|nr:alpha-soluble NSF attachment protein [Pseudomassariella vexata]ORY64366.1 alpha-soluble NSF attachment protein [Pseudomassariella vexata]